MKRTPIILLFLFFFCQTAIALAVEKEVTVTWSMADTTNVSGYRLYYAYDSSMSNKTLACETTDPAATSLTCTNVDLQQSPVYFVLAAVKNNTEEASTPSSQSFDTATATISIVRDFKMEVNTGTPTTNPTVYKINFQPADAPAPAGYQVDSGLTYTADRGYGWVIGPASIGPRDRDNQNSPGQNYDTIMHIRPDSKWEIAVPNGTYAVTVCMGDPSYPDGTENVQAEGTAIINNTSLSETDRWTENTVNVAVNDGRLTLTFSGSTDPARLCWIKIAQVN